MPRVRRFKGGGLLKGDGLWWVLRDNPTILPLYRTYAEKSTTTHHPPPISIGFNRSSVVASLRPDGVR